MTLSLNSMPRCVVLEDVTWDLYQQMLAGIGDGHTRLTFDQGRLAIMSPLPIHEQIKKVLARLVEAYADATDIAVEGLGSTTFKREDLQKGLEPDECYYIAHALQIMRKEEIDLAVDPPPDLAIEVDISRPGIARQPIYAAIGVPEIWRYDGTRVIPLHLIHGHYESADHSLAFPDLPMDLVNEMVRLALTQSQTAAMKAFRDWLKELRA
jgi:Uma2 family endonuclease